MLKVMEEEQTWRPELEAQNCLSTGDTLQMSGRDAQWSWEPLGRTCILGEAPSMGFQADFEESTPGEAMCPVPVSGLSPPPRHPDRG